MVIYIWQDSSHITLLNKQSKRQLYRGISVITQNKYVGYCVETRGCECVSVCK